MIAHAIRLAQASGIFGRVIVSTDDEEIAAIARTWGAEAPFRRPAALSNDTAGTAEVIEHAVRWAIDEDAALFEACCIYPCVPLMQPAYLQRAQQLIREQHKSYCFPVLRFEAPVQRALRLTPDGVAMFEAAHAETRSQDLEPAYHDAGQFYWGTAAAWLERRPLFSAAATALVIPRHHAQDIDTEEDWAFAEKLHAILNETSAQRPAST